MLEALIEVATSGDDLDYILERYARVPVGIYRALGADVLPINTIGIINGRRS